MEIMKSGFGPGQRSFSTRLQHHHKRPRCL